ncbi:hypothetical protein [Alkalibacterium pelagium]|nr:hypothetical protein [Alkalibacterium pelagium]GEN50091.1 hypothetical protein APE02nite_07560 [Alkalibacterium pelagium]
MAIVDAQKRAYTQKEVTAISQKKSSSYATLLIRITKQNTISNKKRPLNE